MNIFNRFWKNTSKSNLKKNDFVYTEETDVDSNGKKITYQDYNGICEIWNHKANVHFTKYEIDNIDDFLIKFNERINSINDSRGKIEQEIVSEFLSIRNNSWSEGEKDKVSKNEFLKRITPNHLTISADLSYELRFDDGDLFWGHTINYSGDQLNNFDSVGLEG